MVPIKKPCERAFLAVIFTNSSIMRIMSDLPGIFPTIGVLNLVGNWIILVIISNAHT